jgi:CBS domain containing-hemolysin-like protein
MNALELVVRLVAGAALILTNGFFVAIEFALTRARQFTEEEFVGAGGQRVAPCLGDDRRVARN